MLDCERTHCPWPHRTLAGPLGAFGKPCSSLSQFLHLQMERLAVKGCVITPGTTSRWQCSRVPGHVPRGLTQSPLSPHDSPVRCVLLVSL